MLVSVSDTGSGGDAELGCAPQAVWVLGSRQGWGTDSLSRGSRFSEQQLASVVSAFPGCRKLQGAEARPGSQVAPLGPGVLVRDVQASPQQERPLRPRV